MSPLPALSHQSYNASSPSFSGDSLPSVAKLNYVFINAINSTHQLFARSRYLGGILVPAGKCFCGEPLTPEQVAQEATDKAHARSKATRDFTIAISVCCGVSLIIILAAMISSCYRDSKKRKRVAAQAQLAKDASNVEVSTGDETASNASTTTFVSAECVQNEKDIA
ncbi:hypothetical protein BT63DRAFT_480165 [Microthyrium microscopicum]|uniref:Uncharacterized protein n=1 Tax=Microthyrium microscopicum TaxID=703497 RepID=A0A6A6U961_9PEZI|nr:hypothetical protein BT63DRAFT_480165 [Microthyrium microscopicum]